MTDVALGVYDNIVDSAVWEPDSAANHCRRCHKIWGLIFTRRHHCRCCGELVCADCSTSEVVTHDAQHLGRVCIPCTTLVMAIKLELQHISAFYEQMNNAQEVDKSSPSLKGSVILRTVSGHLSTPELSRGKKRVTFEGDPPSASQYVKLSSPRKYNTKLVFASSSLSQSGRNSPNEQDDSLLVDLEVTLTPRALQLQKSLDEMTDFQLEKLFKKLSASEALAGIDQEDLQNYPELVFQELLANPDDYVC